MRRITALILCLAGSAAFAAEARTDAAGCLQLEVRRGAKVIWADVMTPAGDRYCPQAELPAAPPVVVATDAVEPPVRVAKVTTRRGLHFVQVGAFLRESNADRVAARLERAGFDVERRDFLHDGRRLKGVSAGPFATQDDLQNALKRLKDLGFIDAFLR